MDKRKSVKKTTRSTKKDSRKPSERLKELFAPKTLRVIKITGAVIVGVLFLSFITYQLYQKSYSKISTEQALTITLSDNIETTGITVRDETLVSAKSSGTVVPAVENGGKVSKGQVVAYIFRSVDDAAAYARVKEIDGELAEFASMETASEDSADLLTRLITERLTSLTECVNKGKLREIDELRGEIKYLLNKRQISTKKVSDFDERISELKTEKSELSRRYDIDPEKITSKTSGYYVNSVDGYESLLTTNLAGSMTPESVESFLAGESEPEEHSDKVGKIADDYKWNIVCAVSAAQAEKLRKGSTYTLLLPYAEIGSIRATLTGMNQGSDTDKVTLVFSCSYLVSELSTVRTQPVVIQVKTYTGIGIKTSALRTEKKMVSYSDYIDDIKDAELQMAKKKNLEKGMSEKDAEAAAVSSTDLLFSGQGGYLSDSSILRMDEKGNVEAHVSGVYVLLGGQVVFREVRELFSQGGTTVCEKVSGDPTETKKYLKLYDEVIVEGRNLYDRKIISIG